MLPARMAERTSQFMQPVFLVDKVFLKRRKPEPLRGVEVFNLVLVRDLTGMGVPLEMAVVRSWLPTLEAELGEGRPRFRIFPETGIDFLTAFLGSLGLGCKGYGTLLIGNVGKSLAPLIRILAARRAFRQAVLIAHREATDGFARMIARLPGTVLAVNHQIAEPFRTQGHARVVVDYGVTNGDQFYPAPSKPASETVHCVVMGMLENAWKGADTAVEAFRALPDAVRARTVLHLASYTQPPSFPEENIRAYPWMPVSDVPAFLRTMDIMIVPSRDEEVMRETFSQAIVQGMLTGLPIVAHRLPVLVEKLDAGGGLVFDDVTELAAQLQRLIQEPEVRSQLGRAARQTARDRYVWDTERFARRYLEWGGVE